MKELLEYYGRQGAPADQTALVNLLKELQQSYGAVPKWAVAEIAENYKIKEKTQSKGYYIDTEIYNANITEDNVINITSKEQVIKNYISILKQYDYVNETTQFLNAEANIRFEIFYPDGTKFGEMTTDKNGYATMNIPYGVWKFHQVNSTTGFEKIYDFFITVDENSFLPLLSTVLL